MRILAMETSFDDTGIAIVDCSGGTALPAFKVTKQVFATQTLVHQPFGGVVPNLAKREHIANIPLLYREVFGEGKKEVALWKTIDLIAVTVGPGLEPALWTGIEFAKTLAATWQKPLVGAHHMQGHLYSTLLPGVGKPVPAKRVVFPAAALIVSGAHTILLSMQDFTTWKRVGETRDDAVGEAFDKVARMLDLPYPGGPEIQRLAVTGDPHSIAFPRPMIHERNYDFSFSGLKTAVLYHLRDNPQASKADVAASFQQAAIDVLQTKTFRLAEEIGAESLFLAGGVAASKALRETLSEEAKRRKLTFFMPDMQYNTDNAAMIAAAAYMAEQRTPKRTYPLKATSRIPL